MDTLVSKEFELQDRDGHWYSVRIRPYKTVENKIDGVVIALLDVDVIKRSLLQSQSTRDYAQAIVETIREPLLVLGKDLKIQTPNRSYLKLFQTNLDDTEGKLLYDIAGGAWDSSAIRRSIDHLWNDVYNEAWENELEFEAIFPHIGRKRLLVSLTRTDPEIMRAPLILLAVKKVVACEESL